MAGQDAYEALRRQRTARTLGERPGVLQDPAPQLVAVVDRGSGMLAMLVFLVTFLFSLCSFLSFTGP